MRSPSSGVPCIHQHAPTAQPTRQQLEQRLWLPVGNLCFEPHVELPDVRLQCDAAQPAVETQVMQPQRWCHVADNHVERDGYPGRVGVGRIVLQLGEAVHVHIPAKMAAARSWADRPLVH
eukprot:364183-Chlamydomonas_euryale.AAC.27